jgi:hypothetical protein
MHFCNFFPSFTKFTGAVQRLVTSFPAHLTLFEDFYNVLQLPTPISSPKNLYPVRWRQPISLGPRKAPAALERGSLNHTRMGLEPKTGNFKIFFTPFLKTTYVHFPPTAKPFFRIKRASPSNSGGGV